MESEGVDAQMMREWIVCRREVSRPPWGVDVHTERSERVGVMVRVDGVEVYGDRAERRGMMSVRLRPRGELERDRSSLSRALAVRERMVLWMDWASPEIEEGFRRMLRILRALLSSGSGRCCHRYVVNQVNALMSDGSRKISSRSSST
jgi:hypothetical protein